MKKFRLLSILISLFGAGCIGESKSVKAEVVSKTLQGIYMERIYLDDNGMPEQDLLLSCDSGLFNSIPTTVITIQVKSVKILVPCKVLHEIDDSISQLDTLRGYGNARVVWKYHRIETKDTGFTESHKDFEYIYGKKHLWWMIDHVLKRHPDAFKTAKWGRQPFPNREIPPDSAWLDTVKQGLF